MNHFAPFEELITYVHELNEYFVKVLFDEPVYEPFYEPVTLTFMNLMNIFVKVLFDEPVHEPFDEPIMDVHELGI